MWVRRSHITTMLLTDPSNVFHLHTFYHASTFLINQHTKVVSLPKSQLAYQGSHLKVNKAHQIYQLCFTSVGSRLDQHSACTHAVMSVQGLISSSCEQGAFDPAFRNGKRQVWLLIRKLQVLCNRPSRASCDAPWSNAWTFANVQPAAGTNWRVSWPTKASYKLSFILLQRRRPAARAENPLKLVQWLIAVAKHGEYNRTYWF